MFSAIKWIKYVYQQKQPTEAAYMKHLQAYLPASILIIHIMFLCCYNKESSDGFTLKYFFY